MTVEHIASLHQAYVDALESQSGLSLPPAPLPATERDLDRIQTTLDREIPTEAANLLRVTSGPYPIGYFMLGGVDSVIELTRYFEEGVNEWGATLLNDPLRPSFFPGEYVCIGKCDIQWLLVETKGERAGRVITVEMKEEINWADFAADVPGALQWTLEATTQLGAFQIFVRTWGKPIRYINTADIEGDPETLDRVRALASNFGGTAAIFPPYSYPPGHRFPSPPEHRQAADLI